MNLVTEKEAGVVERPTTSRVLGLCQVVNRVTFDLVDSQAVHVDRISMTGLVNANNESCNIYVLLW